MGALRVATVVGWVLALVLTARTPAEARALVSLDLCSDWLLMQLASPEQVRALSPMSVRYPAPWAHEPWPTHDGSLEHIVALKPDQIVVGEFNAPMLRHRLSALGFQIHVVQQVVDLDTLNRELLRFQDMLRSHPAIKPSSGVRATAVTASAGVSQQGSAERRGRLLLLGPNGYGTGQGTLESSLIAAAGWRNYLRSSGHRALDLEAIIQDPPDAIAWATPESAALAHRFAEHAVLRRALPPDRWIKTDYWRWQCPGPWSLSLIPQLQQ